MRRVVVFYGKLGKFQVVQVTAHNPWYSSVGRVVVVQDYDHDSSIQNIFNYIL